MAVEWEVEGAPDDWTRVSVNDPLPLQMQHIDERIACDEWLRHPDRPGQWSARWELKDDATALWHYWISDPQVAFEFKMRFG